ncbi:flavodoxin domain-containing protein [Candidatus Bathyarchaeota archaeon]|nr:flavodoxin domain-containing protein [Candidatus Bathyarchaeota archaeon]
MKALIAYGSRYGSTKEIAERMGETLSEAGCIVDVLNVHKETGRRVSDYELVIVGSGIKVGRWTKEALAFLKQNEETLSDREVAFFVSCSFILDPTKQEEAWEKYLVQVAERYPLIKPKALGLFGGVLDKKKYGLGIRFLLKAMAKELKIQEADLDNPYDFRDWEQINEWTANLLNQG